MPAERCDGCEKCNTPRVKDVIKTPIRLEPEEAKTYLAELIREGYAILSKAELVALLIRMKRQELDKLSLAELSNRISTITSGKYSCARPDLDPKFKVGDIVRYGGGPTALMRIEGVKENHGFSGHRYFGIQYFGSPCAAYESDCTLASPTSQNDFNREETKRKNWVKP